jgi:myo-inositol-1(or 4)-monophosphatase
MSDLADLLAIAHRAVDAAKAIMLTKAPGALTAKGDRDMASEVDFAIEEHLKSLLGEQTPDIAFLGEEHGRTGTPSELTWTLDPVDGTVNFIHGSPLCGISLGLLHRDQPVLGVIDLPFLGSRYSAALDHGAYCGEQRITTSTTATLADAVIGLGDYAVGTNSTARNTPRFAVTRELAGQVQRIRMHGSAALDLVWLAAGHIDGVVILSNQPWDIAAGVIIAREAGAHVCDLDGTPHTVTSSATIAANPTLIGPLVGLIADAAR